MTGGVPHREIGPGHRSRPLPATVPSARSYCAQYVVSRNVRYRSTALVLGRRATHARADGCPHRLCAIKAENICLRTRGGCSPLCQLIVSVNKMVLNIHKYSFLLVEKIKYFAGIAGNNNFRRNPGPVLFSGPFPPGIPSSSAQQPRRDSRACSP